jgi:hypothetical protein
LGQNIWAVQEVLQIALQQFFQALRIKEDSVLFLILDDPLVQKTGKKMPGCAWHQGIFKRLMSLVTSGVNTKPFELAGIVATERCGGLELSVRLPGNR